MFEFDLYGGNYGVLYIINVLIYVGCFFCFYCVFLEVIGYVWWFVIVVIFFVCYFFYVELVVWIVECKDVFSMLFGFLMFWIYIRYVKSELIRV